MIDPATAHLFTTLGTYILVIALIFYLPYTFYSRALHLLIALCAIYLFLPLIDTFVFSFTSFINIFDFHLAILTGLLARAIVSAFRKQPYKWYWIWFFVFTAIDITLIALIVSLVAPLIESF